MKNEKRLTTTPALYRFIDGERKAGANPGMTEDRSNLSGNCTSLYGDCSELRGNFDECELTVNDRKNGVNIQDLLGD